MEFWVLEGGWVGEGGIKAEGDWWRGWTEKTGEEWGGTYVRALLLPGSEGTFVQGRRGAVSARGIFRPVHVDRRVSGRVIEQDAGDIVVSEQWK